MKKITSSVKRILPIIALGLALTGCASTTGKHVKNPSEETPSRISFAPAIDVPYSEVARDITSNVGVNVRWGGRVIDSVSVDEQTTRLTVYAFPLSSNGRPISDDSKQQKIGRFIVELTDGFAAESDFDGHFLTFFGGVSGQSLVTNGNRQKHIPVINAEELVDWNLIDGGRNNFNDRRGNAYYSLGYRNGHFGFGSRYGHRFGGSRYGHFSRFHGRSFGGFSRGRRH